VSESLRAEISEVRLYQKQHHTKICDMHKVLHGNGDPNKGLVVQVAKVSTVMTIGFTILGTIGLAVLGALFKLILQGGLPS